MSNDDDDKKEKKKNYKVGYGKPPKHGQIKKGEVRNPKGRPKGSRNFGTEVKETLKLPVRVTVEGKRKTVSTQRAMLMRLRESALKGNARAMDRMIELSRAYNDDELAADSGTLGLDDREILEAYKQRLLRSNATSPANDNGEAADEEAQDTGKAGESPDPLELEEDDDDAWLD